MVTDTVDVTGAEAPEALLPPRPELSLDLFAPDSVLDLREFEEIEEFEHFDLVADRTYGFQTLVNQAKQVQIRIFDLVIAIVLLIPGLPVMVLMALAVKLPSPGSAHYRCERYGLGGRRIKMLKSRTMVDKSQQDSVFEAHPEAKKEIKQNFKLADDPRVTDVGRLLRCTSLDELPQLFNVIRGEMSIVGPRPKLIDEGARYGNLLGVVLSVKPGITGSWQTSGRNDLPFEDRIGLDVEYATNRSFWWDVKICAKTVVQLLSRHHHGAC